MSSSQPIRFQAPFCINSSQRRLRRLRGEFPVPSLVKGTRSTGRPILPVIPADKAQESWYAFGK